MLIFVLNPLKIAAKENDKIRGRKKIYIRLLTAVKWYFTFEQWGLKWLLVRACWLAEWCAVKMLPWFWDDSSNKPIDTMMAVTKIAGSWPWCCSMCSACWCMYTLGAGRVLYCSGCTIVFHKVISALIMCLEGMCLLQSVNNRLAASMDGWSVLAVLVPVCARAQHTLFLLGLWSMWSETEVLTPVKKPRAL